MIGIMPSDGARLGIAQCVPEGEKKERTNITTTVCSTTPLPGKQKDKVRQQLGPK